MPSKIDPKQLLTNINEALVKQVLKIIGTFMINHVGTLEDDMADLLADCKEQKLQQDPKTYEQYDHEDWSEKDRDYAYLEGRLVSYQSISDEIRRFMAQLDIIV